MRRVFHHEWSLILEQKIRIGEGDLELGDGKYSHPTQSLSGVSSSLYSSCLLPEAETMSALLITVSHAIIHTC